MSFYFTLAVTSHLVCTTFSWCVPPPTVFCPLKQVESRGFISSYLFFGRLHPSLLELCNSRGFRAEKRSFYIKLNPLKSHINIISLCILEVGLIDRLVFFTTISLSPVTSAVKWYWGNCTEILPLSIRTGACRSYRQLFNPNYMKNGRNSSDIRNVCRAFHALVCSPWI